MQIGCCTSFDNLSLLDRLGYDFIDLPGAQLASMSELEFSELKHKLTPNRLPCMGFHASIPAEVKIIGQQVNNAIIKDYLEKLIQRAKELDVKFIGIGSPNSRKIPDGYEIEQADEQMLKFLETACELAGNDINILLESLNKAETNYINTINEAEQLIDKLHYKNIGLVFDIYHFLMEQENPNLITSALVKKVKYLHIADPDKRLFPTKGRISVFENVINNLVACGYRGIISIEAITNQIDIDAKEGLKTVKELLKFRY